MSIAPNGQPLCVKNQVRADPTQLYRMYGKSNISHLSAGRTIAAFLRIGWPISGLRGHAGPPGRARRHRRGGRGGTAGAGAAAPQGGRICTARAGTAAPPGPAQRHPWGRHSGTPGAGTAAHHQGRHSGTARAGTADPRGGRNGTARAGTADPRGERSGAAGETPRPCQAWPSIVRGPPRALFEFPLNTRWQGKGRAFAGPCGPMRANAAIIRGHPFTQLHEEARGAAARPARAQ